MVALENIDELLEFARWDVVAYKCGSCEFHIRLPLGFGDAEAGVRGFHVAPEIDAGAAGEGAHLLHDKLLSAHHGIDAAALAESAEARVRAEKGEHFLDDGDDPIVPAEPLVQREFFRAAFDWHWSIMGRMIEAVNGLGWLSRTRFHDLLWCAWKRQTGGMTLRWLRIGLILEGAVLRCGEPRGDVRNFARSEGVRDSNHWVSVRRNVGIEAVIRKLSRKDLLLHHEW